MTSLDLPTSECEQCHILKPIEIKKKEKKKLTCKESNKELKVNKLGFLILFLF